MGTALHQMPGLLGTLLPMDSKTDTVQAEIDGLGWRFDHSYARLPERFHARIGPEPVSAPTVMLVNRGLANDLGLDLSQASAESLAQLFSGNRLPVDAVPLAQAYAGHQFGHFAMLGDGRAVLWGEQITPAGSRCDLQFKGSGRTPFSRRGDGRAALGPMLREYLISEAMHGLGIPTTRSLAVAGTGDWVYREGPESGAVLTRVAASHLRVGSFQYAAGISRPNAQAQGEWPVRQLLNYAIARHDPELADAERPALAFLQAVIARQVSLLVHWMRVGFVHGVMNTDNMALSGETIDYGPCAFIDAYHPDTVFSSIDHAGRYAYGNQPAIAQWNLARLAEALLTEIDPDTNKAIDLAGSAIESFSTQYEAAWFAMMSRKIGLSVGSVVSEDDRALILDLLHCMQEAQADFTHTFWRLGQSNDHARLIDQEDFASWKLRWRARLGSDPAQWRRAQQLMQGENPVVVPRNAQVEEALRAAAQDHNLGPFEALLLQVQHPYDPEGKSSSLVVPGAPIPGYRTFCGT